MKAETRTALGDARKHLSTALERHAEANEAHVEAHGHIGRMREIVNRATTSLDGGELGRVRASLDDLHEAITNGVGQHLLAGNSFSSARRCVRSAKRCLERAFEEEPDTSAHDPKVNPSAAMGAQVSDQQSPRGYSREDRQREVEALRWPE